LASPELPQPEQVERWVAEVPVPTRDLGFVPVQLWSTQRYLLRTVLDGIRDGYRQFYILKSRQVGASSLCLLLTLYWMDRWAGIQGAMIADSPENREFFRSQLIQMSEACAHQLGRETLCLCVTGEEATRPTRNAVQLVWRNQSRLLFQVAGLRTSSRLGVGRGVAFVHATEVARWPKEEAMTYLRASFSERHPGALFIFETTPRGRNWWYDTWMHADGATTRQVFLGWWLREDYVVTPEDRRWERYWTGKRTRREQYWAREVERRWGHRLTDEQLVWRRWFVAEKASGNELLADQEMATLPEEGFEATSSPFLPAPELARLDKAARDGHSPSRFRVEVGVTFESTRIVRTVPDRATLEVWEGPKQGTVYILAAVPPYAAPILDEEDPEGVVSVWAATDERLTQVAEYGDHQVGLQPYAWIIAHLAWTYAGLYQGFVLELTGLGSGVLQELRRFRDYGWGTTTTEAMQTLAQLGEYLWRRPDALGASAAWHWKMTPEFRGWLLARLKDQLLNGRCLVRSTELLEQIARLRQEGSRIVPEGRQPSDHRVLAAALAVEAWARQVLPMLRAQGTRSQPNATNLVRWKLDQLRRRGPVVSLV
jgi:hypothetical protein